LDTPIPTPMPTIRLRRVSEVAYMLGCSPRRVRELAAEGLLQSVRFGPKGHLRFRVEDIEAFMAGEKPDE
jgi:excisionase family DNA binding protein